MQQMTHNPDARDDGSSPQEQERFTLEPTGLNQPLVLSYRAHELRSVPVTLRNRTPNRLIVLTIGKFSYGILTKRIVNRVVDRMVDNITVTLEEPRIFIDSPHSFTKNEIEDLVITFCTELEAELSVKPTDTSAETKAADSPEAETSQKEVVAIGHTSQQAGAHKGVRSIGTARRDSRNRTTQRRSPRPNRTVRPE